MLNSKKYYSETINDPRMKYFNHVYKNSKHWEGENLENKTILIYCQQGNGDVIHVARYFKLLKPAKIIAHCPKILCSLIKTIVDEVYPREEQNIPDHDYHVLSLELPLIFNNPGCDKYFDVSPLEEISGNNIGIAWEGNPDNPSNDKRSCPLKYFKKLIKDDRKLFMLQTRINNPKFIEGCEDFPLYSVEPGDFLHTARLIQSMDMVISVDTAVLHLAGALGKKAIGLLCWDHDRRWTTRKWYGSIIPWLQPKLGDWEGLFNYLPEV